MPGYKIIKEELNTIDFNKKAIQAYCDRLIVHWRERRDQAVKKKDEDGILITKCYIDAYQSVRISLFGQLLSKKKKNKH